MLLIVAMPVLFVLYEKYRYALIPVGLLFPVVIFNGNVYFASLLSIIILGVAFAYEDWFEQLERQMVKRLMHFRLGLNEKQR